MQYLAGRSQYVTHCLIKIPYLYISEHLNVTVHHRDKLHNLVMAELHPPKISLLIINKGMVHVQRMVNVASSSATNVGVKVSLAGHVSIVFRTFSTKYNA